MTTRCIRLSIIACVFTLAFYLLMIAGAKAAQQQPNPQTEQTAEQVYKNIQVFKGVPASRLMQGMTRISQFLGVDCAHCHVPNEFEKDDKPAKQTARKMFELVRTINTTLNTNSVTCYTCHRGKAKPESLPPANSSGADQSLTKPEIKPSASMPAVEQILEQYIRALGGKAALTQVRTRVMKGALVTQGGDRAPLEIQEKTRSDSMSWWTMQSSTSRQVSSDGAVACCSATVDGGYFRLGSGVARGEARSSYDAERERTGQWAKTQASDPTIC